MTQNQFENGIMSLLKSIDKSLGRIANALEQSPTAEYLSCLEKRMGDYIQSEKGGQNEEKDS